MLFLGHMGIGSTLLKPLSRGLPAGWILWGTVLPDLIDKPIYYSLVLTTGKWGNDLGLFSGTRTFGHSGLFLVALTLLAVARGGSMRLVALGLGIMSHLALDVIGDSFELFDQAATVQAIFWPFLGTHFRPIFSHSSHEHIVSSVSNHYLQGAEVLGLLLLVLQLFRARRRSPAAPPA